ncbi:hypothetical protein PR202_ga03045 [Eleusine coracana subsp. coracana]|uniref:USP domain-containing protein n=1 Tax=Eleusine coracana subsp. coracana TaxID=191504 RepID=A0AAV5BL05_ELECO|nr:hypothetical protein PR202_ga03045 [Eleusine coracana subsp. coracana]
MVEAAATTAAEGLMHRRIEFHAATKPNAAPAMAGGFPMERFFSDAGKHMAAARTEGESRRFEKGESSGSGFDPELSAARIYLRRICLTYTEPFVAYLQTGNHKSLSESSFMTCWSSGKDLFLEIGNATTLVKALHNFTKEELLDGGEKHYNCQHCKQKVVAKKRFTIDKAPSVLTIHLKRFSPFNPLRKIDKKVDFQTALNLKPFVSDSEVMDLKYNLYSVLVHTGGYTQFGHYYCFVRTSSGIWHNLDDTQVTI